MFLGMFCQGLLGCLSCLSMQLITQVPSLPGGCAGQLPWPYWLSLFAHALYKTPSKHYTTAQCTRVNLAQRADGFSYSAGHNADCVILPKSCNITCSLRGSLKHSVRVCLSVSYDVHGRPPPHTMGRCIACRPTGHVWSEGCSAVRSGMLGMMLIMHTLDSRLADQWLPPPPPPLLLLFAVAGDRHRRAGCNPKDVQAAPGLD